MLNYKRNITVFLKAGLILLLLFYICPAICSETTYPITLTTKQIQAHFTQFTAINADQDGRDFKFSIDGDIAQRECFDCRQTTDSAVVSFKTDQNLICFEWLNVSFPDSGCFALIQTKERSFTLRETDSSISILYYVSSLPKAFNQITPRIPKTLVASSVSLRVDLSLLTATKEAVKIASERALKGRGWTLLKQSNADILVGRLVKSGRIFKVKMEYSAPWLEIAFAEGFQAKRKNWLLNLKKDVLKFIVNQ